MKNTFRQNLVTVAILLIFSSTRSRSEEWTVIEKGPHHRLVESITAVVQADGSILHETNQVTELATGMHYLKDGEWHDSIERFDMYRDGAIARLGQHQVIIARNINTRGAIDILLPDGKRLVSTPLGLNYYDVSSGENVVLGEIKNCVGRKLADNVILFEDCFADIKASLRYTYTKAGFEQDVILHEHPGLPEDYGLDSRTTRLEFYTEFFDAPEPKRRAASRVPGEIHDQALIFDSMEIGIGRTFMLQDPTDWSPVDKTWEKFDGRDLLIESTTFSNIDGALRKIVREEARNGAAKMSKRLATKGRKPPLIAFSSANTERLKKLIEAQSNLDEEMILVSSNSDEFQRNRNFLNKQGLVLDYVLLNTSQTDYTFKGDETYGITGTLNLSGTTTIEGGAVLKVSPGVTLTTQGAVICRTDQYRPAIVTSRNDNTIGQNVPNSTGLPVKGDYPVGLNLNYGPTYSLANLRIMYASTAIRFTGYEASPGQITVRNSQFIRCTTPFAAGSSSTYFLRNILAYDFGTLILREVGNVSVDGQHITANLGSNLGSGLLSASFKNCLFTDISANTLAYTATGTPPIQSASGVYQTVGAGSHYLAVISSFRNYGVTSGLDSTLLNDLKTRTTYPPTLLTEHLTLNTHLTPRAWRDADGYPDAGYHYDPLDFCWSTLQLSDATLTLSGGVAVGFYGNKGLTLKSGARINSEGTPLALNRVTRFNTVQEQPTGHTWNPTSAGISFLDLTSNEAILPELNFRFTGVSFVGDVANRRYFLNANSYWLVATLTLRDCIIQNAYFYSLPFYSESRQQAFSFINNVFDRSRLDLTSGYSGDTTPFQVDLWNNLFTRATVFLQNSAYAYENPVRVWYIKDNLFDRTSLTAYDYFVASHNGFYSTTAIGSFNKILTGVPNYVSGPFGGQFYYPLTGTLAPLLNAGSRLAKDAGLYHFTLRSDGLKEGFDCDPLVTPAIPATVDIGYHYAAVNDEFRASEAFNGYRDRPNYWKYQYSTAPENSTFVDLPTFSGSVWYGVVGDYWCQIAQDWMHPGQTHDSVRTFVAPITGNITVTGRAIDMSPGSTDGGVKVRILKNGVVYLGWNTIPDLNTLNTPTSLSLSGPLAVNAGDHVQFQVSRITSNTSDGLKWDPIIRYLNSPFSNGIDDSDFDGATDYLEDRNGNGLVDAESNPAVYDYFACIPFLDVVMVMGHSTSMNGAYPSTPPGAKEAGVAFLSFLSRETDQVALVEYGASRVRQEFTSDFTLMGKQIRGMIPGGTADLGSAIKEARLEFERAGYQSGHRRAMILFTDGYCSTTAERNLATSEATLAKNSGIEIFVIGYESAQKNLTLLRSLASGPLYYNHTADLTKFSFVFGSVAQSLCRPASVQPVVYAGPDKNLTLTTPTTLFNVEASVIDYDSALVQRPYTATWTRIEGPANVTFTSRNIAGRPELVQASFTASGTYVLRLSVNNGLHTVHDDVVIKICEGTQRPLDIMLLVDNSSSLIQNGRFEAAKQGAFQFLDRLSLESGGHKVGIVGFTESSCSFLPLTADLTAAKDFLSVLDASNEGTAFIQAMNTARDELLGHRRNPNSLPVMVLITDGSLPWDITLACDTYQAETAQAVITRATQLKGDGITISTINVVEKMPLDAIVDQYGWICQGMTIWAYNTYADTSSMLSSMATPGFSYEIESQTQVIQRLNGLLDDMCRSTASPPPAGTNPAQPLARCDRFFVPEDSRFNYLDVMHNDALLNGLTYTISLESGNSYYNGKVSVATVNGKQVIHYEPNPDVSWTVAQAASYDEFSYRLIENGIPLSPPDGVATVRVWIRPVNDSPKANDDRIEVATGITDPVSVYVLQNDTDPDIHSNTSSAAVLRIVAIGALPANAGTLTIEPEGKYLLFVPNSAGTYRVGYTIVDDHGVTSTAMLTINVVTTPANFTPMPLPDSYTILRNSSTVLLPVLVNDGDPSGDGSGLYIDLVSPTSLGTFGSIGINTGGRSLWYTPGSSLGSAPIITYRVRNSYNQSATATIIIALVDTFSLPPVAEDDVAVGTEGYAPFPTIDVSVLANDYDPEEEQLTVVSVTQGVNGTVSILPDYRVRYVPTGSYRGSDTFLYTVADPQGNRSTARVRVHMKTVSNGLPVGDITNLQRSAGEYPEAEPSTGVPENYRDRIAVVRTGELTIMGEAREPDSTDYFEYQLRLSRLAPDPVEPLDKIPIAIQTLKSTAQVNKVAGVGQPLGKFDLTTVPNGVYMVELVVLGGADSITIQKRFLLDSGLKLGDFSYSTEDLTIPVEGIPLTVVRTYSSMEANAGSIGDFGPGWKYSLVDLDVELDEARQTEFDDDQYVYFSLRVNPDSSSLNSGRNVTLTLPGGRRTTFYFSPTLSGGKVKPNWVALPGISAKLEILTPPGCAEEFINRIGKWECNGNINLDAYDFYGWKLTMGDKTEYIIKREDTGDHGFFPEDGALSNIQVQTWGKPYVAEIKHSSGNRIVIDSTRRRIQALGESGGTVRKQLYVDRDELGRISAIYGPSSLDAAGNPNGPAAIIYDYDDKGNLWKVKKRVKTTGANADYLLTENFYDVNRQHLLKAIVDSRGKRILNNLYDEKGRLKSKIDAKHIETTFDYAQVPTSAELGKTENLIKGKMVTAITGTALYQVTGYDQDGNVIYLKDYQGNETTYKFDAQGSMTEEKHYLGDGSTPTTVFGPTYATANGIKYMDSLEITLPYDASDPSVNPADFKSTTYFEPTGEWKRTLDPSGGTQVRTFDTKGRVLKLYNSADPSGNPTGDALLEFDYQVPGQEVHKQFMGRTTSGTPIYSSTTLNSSSIYASGTGSITDDSNQTISSVFDADLRVTSSTRNSIQSTFSYDDLGRQLGSTIDVGLPSQLSVNYSYDGDLSWKEATVPTVGTMKRTFDDNGRFESWETPEATKPTFTYDEIGRVKNETDGQGNTATYTRDGNNEVIKMPGQKATTVNYTELGAVDNETSTVGGFWNFDYYLDGRLSYVSHSFGSFNGASHAPSTQTGVLQPNFSEWNYFYDILRPGGVGSAPNGSAVEVVDPLGRSAITEFAKEGLVSRTTGNNCCGSTSFTYLVNDPGMEGENTITTITDAGNRVRSYTYYLEASSDGNKGQLKTASDLAGKIYTHKYYQPNVNPYTTQLKQIVAPTVTLRSGSTAEVLMEYGYGPHDRVTSVKYAGIPIKTYEYQTTTPGAVHLPSKVILPTNNRLEYRYENNTSRLRERYIKSSTQTDTDADEKVTWFYTAGDQIDRIELKAPANSATTRKTTYLWGRVATVDVVQNRVLYVDNTLADGDPVRFSTSGTMPGGLTAGTTYYVNSRSNNDFMVTTVQNDGTTAVDIGTQGSGVLTVSDGSEWAALLRSDVTSGVTTPRSEIIRKKRFEIGGGNGLFEEIGVRAKPNGSSTKTYVSESFYNGDGQLSAINVYVDTGLNPVTRSRKFRFEFERDAAGRLELRTAFKPDPSDPNNDSTLTALLESDYSYYMNGGVAANGDHIQSIEHRGYNAGNATVLELVTYSRGAVGEPTSVTWLDNTSVTVGYQAGQGLRVMSEDFSTTSGVESSYSYADNGSRMTKTISGTQYTYHYDAGFQLKEVKQGAVITSTLGYDLAGNVTSISSGGYTLGYRRDDRLKSVALSGSTTTYDYDADGRRIQAQTTTGSGTVDRKFVVGPNSGTDLEVIHMITDGSDNVKVVFIFAGDKPILRFEVNPTTGDPVNPRFYMEDANGSVLGLANDTGGLNARFRYDGFGLTRPGFTDPRSLTYTAPGARGDFRYHGAWLEADSGFYHMRSRNYDPVTGRFLERDPVEGDSKVPETLHAYAFALNNPYYYSDPTGAFTIVEVNVVGALHGSLQGLRGAAVAYGRKKAFNVIGNLVRKQVIDRVKHLMPVDDFLASFKDGVKFGNMLRRTICRTLKDTGDNLFFEVPITVDGKPMADGFSCNERVSSEDVLKMAALRVPRPDMVIGQKPPYNEGSRPKSYVITEIKATTATLYTSYIRPGYNPEQFWAVVNYAKKHTYSRTALFVTGVRGQIHGQPPPADAIIAAEIAKSTLPKGVLPVIVRIVD